MGAGKSTVGRLIADQLGLPFFDTDRVIEERVGKPVAEVFATQAEQWFRQLERDVIAELLAGPEAVVALGGGALGDPATAASLEWADVVFLETDFATIRKRLGDDVSRPLWTKGDPRALYEQREDSYRRAADLVVTTDGRLPHEIAAEIAASFRGVQESAEEDGPIWVRHTAGSYPVIVGSGLLDVWPTEIGVPPSAEQAFVISHQGLRTYSGSVRDALSSAGLKVRVLEVPQGEPSKSLGVAAELFGALASEDASRRDIVVSVGGGVVSDLAGYVASTYVRGLPVVHVPTTLLGQVDAAIGGKTGVNLELGKNLVGTFHQPAGVVIDVETLRTLPGEEFTSGMAEVLKYAFIADPSLLELTELGPDSESGDLIDVVSRSVTIKGDVVASDERESGRRAVLNYGHTFAHAIEASWGYGAIRHGEAVALGMMAAAHLSHIQGRAAEDLVSVHRDALSAAKLPVSARLDLEVLARAWRRDKKYERGVRFVLLDGLAKPAYGVEATDEELMEAIRRMAE